MSRLEDIRYCVETEEENYTMPFARQRTMAHRRYLLGLVDRLAECLRNLNSELKDNAEIFWDYAASAQAMKQLIAEMEDTDGEEKTD